MGRCWGKWSRRRVNGIDGVGGDVGSKGEIDHVGTMVGEKIANVYVS